MGPYIDSSLYAGHFAPPVPLWYLVPFTLCLAGTVFGGSCFGRMSSDGDYRTNLKRQNTWVRALVVLASLKFLTSPATFLFSIFTVTVVADVYELWAEQRLALMVMLCIATWFGWRCFGNELERNGFWQRVR